MKPATVDPSLLAGPDYREFIAGLKNPRCRSPAFRSAGRYALRAKANTMTR